MCPSSVFKLAGWQAYLTAAAVHALVVVAAEGLAVDEGERGDDEDDAGRCRSDARARPSTAFVAAERVGGTVDSDGADITREREKKTSGTSAFAPTRNGSRLGRGGCLGQPRALLSDVNILYCIVLYCIVSYYVI